MSDWTVQIIDDSGEIQTVEVSPPRGLTGPPGPQGPKGDTGAEGPAGYAGTISYDTKALMDADTGRADGTKAVVANDANRSNNNPTVWISHAGIWTKSNDRLAPTEAAVANLQTTIGLQQTTFPDSRTVVGGLADGAGRSPIFVLSDGAVTIVGIETVAKDLTLWTRTDVMHAVADRLFRAVQLYLNDGSVEFPGGVNLGGLKVKPINRVFFSEPDILDIEGDISGRASKITYTDGSVRFPGGIRDLPTPEVGPLRQDLLATVAMSWSFGQSTSIGLGGNPPLTIVADPASGTIMFVGGIRFFNNPDMTAFTRAIETVDPGGSNAYGETGMAVSGNYAVKSLHDDFGLPAFPDQGFDFLVAAGGHSGARIAQLSAGQPYWNDGISMISNAFTVCQGLGKPFVVVDIEFTQGETDQSEGMREAVYTGYLLRLRSDTAARIKQITGQPNWEPFMLVTQLAAHLYYYSAKATNPNYVDALPTPEIAMAQMAAAAQDKNIKVCFPAYILDYVDNVHRVPESYRFSGYYQGYGKAAIMAARMRGEEDPPIATDVVSVFRQGRLITVRLSMPTQPVQIRTDFVAAIVNSGFDIWAVDDPEDPDPNSYVLADIIASVATAGPDTLLIKLNADPPANAVLTYAFGRPGVQTTSGRTTGPRGNVCDSHGSTHTYPASDGTRRLDHYLLMFRRPI